ncbi:MAG: M6 family metalloprotease domain-containing protein [Bacteroides sp.]|nr:M6 family metalloprotease domain-containing protein [Bacteroides sp.]
MTFFTNSIKTLILSTAIGVIGTSSLYAVVAKPGLVQTEQPDGSVVNLRLEGSFGNHRAYTSDGYLLTTNEDGFYVFAGCDASGLPVATDILATDPENRTAEMTLAIRQLDQSVISDAFIRRNQLKPAKANAIHKGPGLFSSHFPSKGEQRAIAILVNFSNKKFLMDEEREMEDANEGMEDNMWDANDYYTRQLNEEGFSDYGATGSARDYFVENSYGNFLPTFDVYGPVTLAHPYSYYGANDYYGNDKRPHEMVIEACQLLDDEVDFSEYDRNGDGVIDNVYIYYAGFGEADGGGSSTVWPHSFDIEYASDEEYFFDGVKLNHYACSNELDHSSKTPAGIGTFTHEFSHVLGLPDLYDTYSSGAFTPGEWNILDVGNYNNNACTPPHYSSYERYALDWMEPEILSEVGDYTLEILPQSNKAYMIPTEEENEYFLLENRQHVGNDRFLPGHGMLVWHIDFKQEIWDANIVNNTSKHQYVDLVEADNERKERSRDGDSFPGTAGVTSFGSETTPALLSWGGVSPGFDITDIAESEDGLITFTVKESQSGIDKIIVGEDSRIVVSGRFVSCLAGVANIYDLSGKLIASVGETPVTVDPGLYIIVSGSDKRKVVIK